MTAGHATPTGTQRFCSRFPELERTGHFRRSECARFLSELWFSSLGIGTYLGEPDSATDARYTEAAISALAGGINVLDSAINYRFQRSERNIGAAVEAAMDRKIVHREEIIVSTKAGYLTYDGTVPADPRRYFLQEYIDTGVVPREELVGGMHCIAPSYLRNQLERSLRNLDLETIDIFYVHNPEQQLSEVSRDVFFSRLRQSFAALEEEVSAGRIRVYGTATWNGYRQDPNAKDYLDLAHIVQIAKEVAGETHHFRVLQAPFNLGLPELHTKSNQKVGTEWMSLLQAAQELEVVVIGSAALLQGRLTARLPEFVRERLQCRTDAEAAIQFARSAPGITSALIGMSRTEHVKANLEIASKPLASREQWDGLFSKE
jgi:aryl-alcohol dehydrogenase-like predicted oxidoreductase